MKLIFTNRDVINPNDEPHAREDLMRVFIYKVDEPDSPPVEDTPSWRKEPKHYTWADKFWWTEGNMGCDCNRYLQWERGHGREPKRDVSPDDPGYATWDGRCTERSGQRYFVVLTGPLGVAQSESDEGANQ